MEKKFCKDCQHFTKSELLPNDLRMGRCARVENRHPVDGKANNPFAETERMEGNDRCGPDGKYFKLIAFLEVHDYRDYKTSSTNHDLDRFGAPLKEGT